MRVKNNKQLPIRIIFFFLPTNETLNVIFLTIKGHLTYNYIIEKYIHIIVRKFNVCVLFELTTKNGLPTK